MPKTDFSKTPPRILLHPSDSGGCGTWRALEPAKALRAAGLAITATAPGKYLRIEELKALRPDIVVVQRQGSVPAFAEAQCGEIASYRQSIPDLFIVYDIDDLLWQIPHHNPAWNHNLDRCDKWIRQYVRHCDAVVCSTEELACQWKKVIGDQIPVRVRGNYLPEWFFSEVGIGQRMSRFRRRDQQVKPRVGWAKPRVGWAGGSSHAAMLTKYAPLIKMTSHKVQWVFMGCKPNGLDDIIEFHPSRPIKNYPMGLGEMGLDVAFCPFENSTFDRCKTDLRIAELGALGIPMLDNYAQRDRDEAFNYLTSNPDAFIRWVEEASESAERFDEARFALHRSRYLLEAHLPDVLTSWLPAGSIPFDPGHPVESDLQIIPEGVSVVGTFPEASMRAASATLISNNGDFPVSGAFTALPPDIAADIARAGKDLKAPVIALPGDACAVLRREALQACGFPDFERYADRREALLDWSEWTAERGFFHFIHACGIALKSAPGSEPPCTVDRIAAWFPGMDARYQASLEAFESLFGGMLRDLDITFAASRCSIPGATAVLIVNGKEEDTPGGIPNSPDDRMTYRARCAMGSFFLVWPPLPNVPAMALSENEDLTALEGILKEFGVEEVQLHDPYDMTLSDIRALASLPGFCPSERITCLLEWLAA